MSGLIKYYIKEIRQKIWGSFKKRKLVKEKGCTFQRKSKVRFFDSIFEGKNVIIHGAHINGCEIGYASYVAHDTILNNTKIGKYCSIGPGVRIMGGEHPTRKFVSTYPAFYTINPVLNVSYASQKMFPENRFVSDGFFVEVGNDVWIGSDVLIRQGVKIADGTIVAAGAVVTENTEPYSIVGGVPAKLIKYRFDAEDISFLMNLQWWYKGGGWIEEYAKYFDDIKNLRKALGD